jgi:hypothetical protein
LRARFAREVDMPDLASIQAALTSIKVATDIAKFFRSADLSLEKAESKMKLAELMEALAEAKIEIASSKFPLCVDNIIGRRPFVHRRALVYTRFTS